MDVPSLVANLALNRPATQSSTSSWSRFAEPERDAAGANDGTITGRGGFHTEREFQPWWSVDLGAPFRIESIRIHNRRDCAERLKHFRILRSLDGEQWITMYRKIDGHVFGATDDLPHVAMIEGGPVARHVRVQIEDTEYLHFDECEISGSPADDDAIESARRDFDRVVQDTLRREEIVRHGRQGEFISIGQFSIFLDTEKYSEMIQGALRSGGYEGTERWLVSSLLRPSDRVLEIGTAIGVVSMTAAAIVGGRGVVTFDANPEIVRDAQDNFILNNFVEIGARNAVLCNRAKIGQQGPTETFHISRNFWASRLFASPDDGDILRVVDVPVMCLEDAIEAHDANVLICDIEGGEVGLLDGADLSAIRLIVMETHYGFVGEHSTDQMIGYLIGTGFSIDLVRSAHGIVVLRRH